MNIEIQPYFAEGERYPALIGVRVEGDEYQMAYVSKVELADALAENAKLLELVEDMLDCIQIRAAFSRPPTKEMYEMFYKRARELGVDG